MIFRITEEIKNTGKNLHYYCHFVTIILATLLNNRMRIKKAVILEDFLSLLLVPLAIKLFKNTPYKPE